MTTNIDLINMAKTYDIILNNIIFKDELVKLNPKNSRYIVINMSNLGHPGTHWISLGVIGKTLYYFDSFGVEPPVEVENWANKYKLKIVYSDYQIQHLDSIMCGQHSIGFIGLLQGKKINNLLDDS